MVKQYHILMVRVDGRWEHNFGDYVKAVVEQERQDWLEGEGFRNGAKRKDAKVVACLDTEESIREAVCKG